MAENLASDPGFLEVAKELQESMMANMMSQVRCCVRSPPDLGILNADADLVDNHDVHTLHLPGHAGQLG